MSRNFAFTYHIQDGDEEERILALNTKYLIFQYEEGKDSSGVHLQGFMIFEHQKKFTYIQERCHGIWVTSCRASAMKNITYCSKADTRIAGPFEHGDRPCQGYRNDLLVQCDQIKSGKDVNSIMRDDPRALRNEKYLLKYKQILTETKRNWNVPPNVHVRYGKLGLGKTRHIYEKYGPENIFSVPYKKGNTWWDGYCGQAAILFDDWPLVQDEGIYHEMLKWTDRYPCRVQVKCGMTDLGTSDIYITTNDPPITWFGGKGLAALARRLTTVTHVQKDKETLDTIIIP
nr:MAG: replication associated protein [Cressdnaviricota sp.]